MDTLYPPKLHGQSHSHTHYRHVYLNIQWAFAHFCVMAGTVSVNTLQEFALGSPASLGATALRFDGWGAAMSLQPALFLSQQTPISLCIDEQGFRNTGEWTSAQVCTTGLILLMISGLDFPFEQTLTWLIFRQTHQESQVSTDKYKLIGKDCTLEFFSDN